MKTIFGQTVLISAFAVLFAFVAGANAQPTNSGEFKVINKGDVGARLAADFAVKERSAQTKKTVKLGEIVKAEDQSPLGKPRIFRLCLNVIASGKSLSAQAVVSMDMYSNLKLERWTEAACGDSEVFKPVRKGDAGADMAADFAVREQSKKTKTTITLDELVNAEDQESETFSRKFRLCLAVSAGGKSKRTQAVVTMDQYSNLKLISWSETDCGGVADEFTPVEDDDAGPEIAADFAVKERSAKTKTKVTLGELIKAEDQEFKNFSRNFRLCLEVETDGKQSVVQAIVSMDQYSNFKLLSWTASDCDK